MTACLCGDPACPSCFPRRQPYPVTCSCCDPRCPHHPGYDCMAGASNARGGRVLHRIDMDDRTGTRFCCNCAADALASGLFR